MIVPTRDRASALERCLAALHPQLDGAHVVVVDDGSADVAAVVRAAGSEVTLVRLEGRGASAARNAGVAATDAQLLLFVDDDCEPQPGWLAALAGELERGRDVVAGRIETASTHPTPVAADLVTAHLHRDARSPFASASNLGCRREVLERVPFDESYPGAAAEDREWCDRVVSAGFGITAVAAAVVRHHRRRGLRAFWAQQFDYGRGSYRFHRVARRRRFERASFYTGLVGRGFRKGPRVGLLICLAQVATAAGYATEAVGNARRGERQGSSSG